MEDRMRVAALVALAGFVCTVVPSGAQTPSRKSEEQIEALVAAHKGDFDYLLGDWEFTGTRKTPNGDQKFRGVWSAARLADGQVLDEYRVVGDAGETWYVTTTLRNYNAFADRWELVGASPGQGLQDFGTAQKDGAEMRIEQRFGVASGSPHTWRIRYHGIQADRFSWTADRSTDGGSSWVKDHQQIEARRTGPARSLPALAPARKMDAPR
jgi:hypothetical protein